YVPSSFLSTHTTTTSLYSLSLHDALPISSDCISAWRISAAVPDRCGWTDCACRKSWTTWSPTPFGTPRPGANFAGACSWMRRVRSEEHTSELQSRENLVCRLLLEKKKNIS